MKKNNTFVAMLILIAVLLLGIGYAAISNITLIVNGNANIVADSDFDVEFDTTHTVGVNPASGSVTFNGTDYPPVSGAYANSTVATMAVYLDKDYTSVSACYKIDNKSSSLAAGLSANVTQIGSPNTAYFGTITTGFYADSACSSTLTGNLSAGSSAYLLVTVPKGTTEPTDNVTNAAFTVTVNATPQTP